MSSLSTNLLTQSNDPAASRRGEPVSCGIPWPQGAVDSVEMLRLVDASGTRRPLQARALDHWPDGSVRWTLLDWLADTGTEVTVEVDGDGAEADDGAPTVTATDDEIVVDTGPATFRLRRGDLFPFAAVRVGGIEALDAPHSGLTARDDGNGRQRMRTETLEVEEAGPVRVTIRCDGRLAGSGGTRLLDVTCRVHLFRGSACAKLDLTVTNPRRAGHPGGIWTLGGDGSVYLRDLSLSLATPRVDGAAAVRLSSSIGAASEELVAPIELYQASSGGPNWQSPAHVDRSGKVPLSFAGFQLRTGSDEQAVDGARATPIVEVTRGDGRLAVALPEFWQNFPKVIEASGKGIIARLFPRQLGACHEIQGGERKTHTLWIAFGDDPIAESPLSWTLDQLLPHARPAWYAESGAIPYLVPQGDDLNSGYLELVSLALEGDDTLEHKREAVDEYGWRHFGDVWADHESAHHEGDDLFISHYNNQYDMVGGFATHFIRSTDRRWHTHMRQLARHVADVDIYHTSRDKSAYSGGMFWHTVHYIDAGGSTHRSYPRADGVPGGGPSTGHLYSAGLWLHYLLTGDALSREAVIDLGDYVIKADDGRRTVFRFLDRGATGHVTNSGFDDYHGPGRSAANAITALVHAHRATQDQRYLDYAELLMRRCVHPDDDVEALDLLDADRKWFYTMFFQSLGDYLDYKIELGELDEAYAYGRAALLRYADWAAEHEYPYLDRPEILEFPTETWAAQDMRKCELFRVAARHSEGDRQRRFLERGRFFFDASVDQLLVSETRAYARPLALLLSNGWRQAWVDRNGVETAPPADRGRYDFGSPEVFVSQKRRAMTRAKRLVVGAWALAVAALGATALVLWLS